MAVKDGLPSTDFSRMNREWVMSVASEGGVGLPPVTEADNGKILGVVNGAWGAMDAGGGGGSSDFSTAEVQVTLGQGVTLVSIAGAMTRTVEGQTSAVADNRLDSSGTISVILCGETSTSLLLEIEPSNATVVTTGDINNYYSEDDELEVFGPGTITITVGS